MVSEVRSKSIEKILGFDGHVYAFDSTTIDLCLEVFEWAKFRKYKRRIKIYTLYNIEAQVPTFFHITTASTNDIKAILNKGAHYIFDRDYNNFSDLFKKEQIEATFVIHAKKTLRIWNPTNCRNLTCKQDESQRTLRQIKYQQSQ